MEAAVTSGVVVAVDLVGVVEADSGVVEALVASGAAVVVVEVPALVGVENSWKRLTPPPSPIYNPTSIASQYTQNHKEQSKIAK